MEEEAKIVRLIFFLYLFGYTCQEIADTLTEIGCETKRGNNVWNPGSILQILRNERYCGDVLTRKTFTPSYLDHKSRKNMGDRTQHRWKDRHDPIIARDDFIAVQQLINNAKYGNKGILPELHVIKEGALKGFVPIHPRWAGFREEHYINACMSAFADDETIESPGEQQVVAQGGDFDFRGFEIARSQFFDVKNKLTATFSDDSITFSTACIRKFDNCQYVELLVHPVQNYLAVRPSKKGARNAVQWAKLTDDGLYVPRYIAGAAFLSTIYSLFEWDATFKYRICGVRKKQGDDAVLMFDLQDTEVFMPEDQLQIPDEQAPELDGQAWLTTARKSVIGYPSDWADSFGMSFYRHAQARELAAFMEDGTWQIAEQAQPYEDAKLAVTGREELQQGIQDLMREIRQDMKREEITDGS